MDPLGEKHPPQTVWAVSERERGPHRASALLSGRFSQLYFLSIELILSAFLCIISKSAFTSHQGSFSTALYSCVLLLYCCMTNYFKTQEF